MTADVVHNGSIYNNMAVGNEAYSPFVIFYPKLLDQKWLKILTIKQKSVHTYIEK